MQVISAALFSFVTAATAASFSPRCEAAPRLNSTFLEGYFPADWTTSDWNTLDINLKNASITHVILQYSAQSDPDILGTYYPPGPAVAALGFTQIGSSDVLGTGLSRADANGISIVVGLQLDESEWWSNAGNTAWLDKQLGISQALARDIVAKYGSHASFAGWYLPFEVDNCQLQSQAEQQAFIDHYWGPLTKTLNTIKPGAKVYISPVFDSLAADGCGTMSAWSSEWKTMFQRLKSSSSYGAIDIITLQDGVGALLNQPSSLSGWYSSLKSAMTSYYPAATLWSNTETYSDPNAPNPMPLKQVVADMNAVASSVSGYTSFTYAEYDNPQFVNAAYNATYVKYLSTGVVESAAPTAPPTLSARAGSSGSRRINLSWTASSDNIGVVAYRVYRDGAALKTLYSLGTGQAPTTYADTGLTRGQTYSYQVLALDAAGNVSSFSTTASGRAP